MPASAAVCGYRQLALWITEMDLLSLHLQRDSFEALAKMRGINVIIIIIIIIIKTVLCLVLRWDFAFFALVTLTLTRSTWYMNLTEDFVDVPAYRSELSR